MSELIGKTIDQYQIVELIEEAGDSWTYKGFQPSMDRYVAFKVLKSQDPVEVDAFKQQNTILAQIRHANILPVLDSGSAAGLSYRVLPFIENGLLRDHLFEYYDSRKAAGLISGVVAGLEKIHAQGYVHANLEPGNIYLEDGGVPLLTDFGLPKSPSAPLTPYMSPEQTQGGVVDRRTDVYALGVLLYEMLTGEAPPPGVVVSLRTKRADLPESVEKVIFKAMAQNPDARFQSAAEFQVALTSALQPVVPASTSATQPVTATTQAAAPPPPVQKKTNWAAIILGTILVIVICGGIVLLFSWLSSQDGETPAEPTSPPAEIIPTQGPEPTQEPQPTDEPAPTEEPEATQPPEVENPIETPGEGVELPEVCSSTGFAGGFFLLGSILMFRKRMIIGRKRTRR
jgi:serine/threonine protein kinase